MKSRRTIFNFYDPGLAKFSVFCRDKKTSLSYLISSGIPYELKLFVTKFITFVSDVLQTFTLSYLLNPSTATSICTSP